MLTNMAKNLSRISFAELTELTEKLRAVDQLMAAAQGIDFRIDTLDTQFKRLFPDNYDMVTHSDVRLASARERFDAARQAYQQSMRVQSQVVGNVAQDAAILEILVGKRTEEHTSELQSLMRIS